MTKLIGVLVIVLVAWGGYGIFEMWNKFDTERDVAEKKAEAERNFSPESLSGMPYNLQKSWEIAQKRGTVGIGEWLKAYHTKVQDPRLGWIELDYAVGISQKDPVEAKKIYQDVKNRTPKDSPIYPRVKQLEKTYE